MQEQSAVEGIMRQSAARSERSWRISGMESCRAPLTRVEAPAPALANLVARYETWSPPANAGAAHRTLWALPGEARLMITREAGEVSALIGNRRYESLPEVVLFGPRSRAARLTASGGEVVSVVVSALGWANIVGRSAAALGDRVVPAAEVFDGRLVAALAASLTTGGLDGLATRLDAAVGTSKPLPCPDEPLVRGLSRIIAEGGMCAAEAAGEQLGVASHVVRRSALRHFGYPPKVLLNRGRFLRALERMIISERGYSEAARHGYFDASHFIRDAKRFLGMTPRRFLALVS